MALQQEVLARALLSNSQALVNRPWVAGSSPAFSQARRKTFWETPEFWLTGYTFPSFWRPNDVPVRVGDTVERGFHLIQFWMWHREAVNTALGGSAPTTTSNG